MTIKEAHAVMEDLQRIFTRYRSIFSNKLAEANGLAILALEKQMEETDDTDKLKFVAHKLDKLDEKIQQLEKDVDRLERSRTIEVRYPDITSTGISAYAGPEFGGVCTDSTDLTWTRTDEEEAR